MFNDEHNKKYKGRNNNKETTNSKRYDMKARFVAWPQMTGRSVLFSDSGAVVLMGNSL